MRRTIIGLRYGMFEDDYDEKYDEYGDHYNAYNDDGTPVIPVSADDEYGGM